jgi:hypothetical protein
VTGLRGDHRTTLEKILRHPASGDIEWPQVRSLLEAVDATTEEPNGKIRVTLVGETEVLQPPRGKDIDPAMIVDLRRMFTSPGFEGRDLPDSHARAISLRQ